LKKFEYALKVSAKTKIHFALVPTLAAFRKEQILENSITELRLRQLAELPTLSLAKAYF